jgi:uncharacterized protein DUF3168
MSYAQGGALQAAVFAVVSGDAWVQALIGGNVFDAPPGGALPQTYVVLGEEDARGRRNGSVEAALHEFTVTVISDATGFALAKAVGEAVSDALLGASLVLARGRVVDLAFLRAQARRGKSPESRRVDLRFRAWVEDV